MRFRDRSDAAHRLAERLGPYRDRNPLILAVPRGGVPLGRIIADALGGELDLVLVQKLRGPIERETAVGAVDEPGVVYLEPKARSRGAYDAWLQRESEHRLTQLRRRAILWRSARAIADPAGRTLIVVDDGAATGATMTAALRALQRQCPAHLVAALPVVPRGVMARLQREADRLICLYRPWLLRSVGQAYRRFETVDDERVRALLHGSVAVATHRNEH